MAEAMNQFKATADAHMRRDFEAGKQWMCECEACCSIRALVGMEKMLDVRPLVREIEETEERLKGLPDGPPSPEKRRLQEHYMKLYDGSRTRWPSSWGPAFRWAKNRLMPEVRRRCPFPKL